LALAEHKREGGEVMFRQVSRSSLVLVGFLSVVVVGAQYGCSEQASSTTYDRLRDYVDTIQVINTHEHQRTPPGYEEADYNLFTIIASSYLNADLVSAGAPVFDPAVITQRNPEELWNLYGRYLDYSRNTTYYSHLLAGIRALYGFEEPYFTQETITTLSETIEKNYADKEGWYAASFEKAGFELMFLDQFWDNFNVDIDDRYFALVININSLVFLISDRDEMPLDDESVLTDPFELAENEGFSIGTLDDYLDFADNIVKKFIEHGAVCFKSTLAYMRTIDFEAVGYERAKELFAKSSNELSPEEKKQLQDFMFHWVVQKSIEVGLPFQIHTGYLAGNANILENSRPTKLNNLFLSYPDARFVLFHGAYPWTGEFSVLGKMFPNVHLDLVWLPQLSREAAILALDEMLDGVPYNKFFWGGDCQYIEESAGSLIFAKDVVSKVLASRVDRGLMTEEVAREVARRIFRENAIEYFGLETRLEAKL
jgi:hypothetical protein